MIPILHVVGRSYLILGFAKSGQAAAAALKASGATVYVWDDKEETRAKAVAEGYLAADLEKTDFRLFHEVVMAPGVPLTHPAPHPVVIKAREAGVPIISDLDLLFRACPSARYIGITGTNGKSTTTALIAHILQNADCTIQMGGNIGTPALSLEPLGAEGIYVLELSSYQLDLMTANPLEVAVWLNVTPDHFDRHGNMAGYIAAKTKIVRTDAPQTLVIGTDEPEMREIFSRLKNLSQLKVEEISVQHAVSQGVRGENQKLYITNESEPLDLSTIKALPGAHNTQNAAAAYAACRALGLSRSAIEAGLKSFPGLAHRQQRVAEIDGVTFINDSKATNADAASKALVCYDNIYWIIGGKPKIGGLNGLEGLMGPVQHAFIIGQASDEFAAWCEGKVPYTRCLTLDVAVQKAAAMAWNDKKKDAVVLLSPACASWDQFSSFEERGDRFADYVRALKKEG